MDSKFGFLARILYRSPAETSLGPLRQTRDFITHLLLFSLIFSVSTFAALAIMSAEFSRWSLATPTIAIEPDAWKVYVPKETRVEPISNQSNSPCIKSGPLGADCLAVAAHKEIFSSSESRANPVNGLKSRPGRPFWIGTEISKEQLAGAREAKANQLVVGKIEGKYSLWINGHLLSEGERELDRLIITIPWEYFDHLESMKVSLLIQPSSDSSPADILAYPGKEGLATATQASAYRNSMAFQETTAPFFIFLLSLLLAVTFLILWIMRREMQEYFYLSLFAAVCALLQLRFSQVFEFYISSADSRKFDVFLFSIEGGFGLLMAMAFARSRAEIFRWGIPTIAFLPILLQFSIDLFNFKFLLAVFLAKYFVPLCYFLGAGGCAIQASFLFTSKIYLEAKGRFFRLSLFSGSLVLLGILGTDIPKSGTSDLIGLYEPHFLKLFLLLLLAGIAMSEYVSVRAKRS